MTTTQQQTTTQIPKAQPAGLPRGGEYRYLFRLAHWLLGGGMIALVATGLSVHAIARPDWSIFRGHLPAWLLEGRVGLWHLVAAAVFVPAVLAAAWGCRGRGVWRRGGHLALLTGALAMVASGAIRLDPPRADVWHRAAVLVHASLGLVAMPVLLLWHSLGGLTRRRRLLVASFRPFRGARLGTLLGLLVLAALTTWALAGFWPLAAPWRTLTVKRIAAPGETATANLAALPWDQARPLAIKLTNGANLRAGQTLVTLRALHDGKDLYLQAQWDDPTEDRQYSPWKKTAEGWHRLTMSAEHPDVYYEDKFSLVFPAEADWLFNVAGCAATCHAGGGRDYGYKGGPTRIDCWHWKAVRTDPLGQVDDQYWSVVDFSQRNVGRLMDPKTSGGYEDNLAKAKKGPAWLPPATQPALDGAIHKGQAVACTSESAAAVPVGALVPGIVISPFVGDRGDVTCQSAHSSGRWTVHFRRRLDTASQYDAAFTPGGRVPFGLAAFDCTSDRHAYTLPVYWMTLEK